MPREEHLSYYGVLSRIINPLLTKLGQYPAILTLRLVFTPYPDIKFCVIPHFVSSFTFIPYAANAVLDRHVSGRERHQESFKCVKNSTCYINDTKKKARPTVVK